VAVAAAAVAGESPPSVSYGCCCCCCCICCCANSSLLSPFSSSSSGAWRVNCAFLLPPLPPEAPPQLDLPATALALVLAPAMGPMLPLLPTLRMELVESILRSKLPPPMPVLMLLPLPSMGEPKRLRRREKAYGDDGAEAAMPLAPMPMPRPMPPLAAESKPPLVRCRSSALHK